jgi:ArsR family transcriptional regulator, arsenate/arsenite/antimonite-responsive transcriptional repressor / arsenate reductase (thioredoxin)
MTGERTSGRVGGRAAVHAALGDPHRLAIVDALALSDLAPSELGDLLDLESNLLAHHLDVLADAGIVDRSPSHGDRRRRYLRLRRDTLDAIARPLTIAASSVLFVCTANSARSQLAAAMWNARHAVPAASAGTDPAARVHPQARRAAARRGLDLDDARPRSLDEISLESDLVVTVCDRAHEQLRHRRLRPTRLLHWSVADPAEAGTTRAFDAAADELARRIDELAPVVTPSPRPQSRTAKP